MSQKVKNPYADTEFIRAYQESVEALGKDLGVRVVTLISAGAVKGQLMVRLDAHEDEEEEPERPLCSYVGYWPNSGTAGFTAFLFQAAVKLERLVTDSRGDFGGQKARPHK